MKPVLNRRQFLGMLVSLGLSPGMGWAAPQPETPSTIGAAWRGPNPGDPYFAGTLIADWSAATLRIGYRVRLPTRPHGLVAEADGGLLAVGVRPGAWLLRSDGGGRIVRQYRVEDEAGACRLNGHAVVARGGEVIYTTETDRRSGAGRIGVRDGRTLEKIDQWDSGGVDPHQAICDRDGTLLAANGGVPRDAADRKFGLDTMDSSLVRLAAANGRPLDQWRLGDPRLSMRHLAWSQGGDDRPCLGIALQAEHDDPARRAAAPVLAVLADDRLIVPAVAGDGSGYAGDVAAAWQGGFVVSSNQSGTAQFWHPARAGLLSPVVKLKETAALATWSAPDGSTGIVVATSLGLVRWHPVVPPVFLHWPEPMALDNHWVLIA